MSHESNNSLYIQNNAKCVLLILVYVDNLIIGNEELAVIQKMRPLLSNKFKMKDLGGL
jgi:hypothetical protein